MHIKAKKTCKIRYFCHQIPQSPTPALLLPTYPPLIYIIDVGITEVIMGLKLEVRGWNICRYRYLILNWTLSTQCGRFQWKFEWKFDDLVYQAVGLIRNLETPSKSGCLAALTVIRANMGSLAYAVYCTQYSDIKFTVDFSAIKFWQLTNCWTAIRLCC